MATRHVYLYASTAARRAWRAGGDGIQCSPAWELVVVVIIM